MSNTSITQNNILSLYPAITVNQETTARLIGVTTNTVRNYVRQGKLHPKPHGRNQFYDLDEVNALVRPRNKHSQSIYLIADTGDYETFINQVAGDVLQAIKKGSTETEPIET